MRCHPTQVEDHREPVSSLRRPSSSCRLPQDPPGSTVQLSVQHPDASNSLTTCPLGLSSGHLGRHVPSPHLSAERVSVQPAPPQEPPAHQDPLRCPRREEHHLLLEGPPLRQECKPPTFPYPSLASHSEQPVLPAVLRGGGPEIAALPPDLVPVLGHPWEPAHHRFMRRDAQDHLWLALCLLRLRLLRWAA